MKLIRVLSGVALAVVFLFGVASFSPAGACGGSGPGSCRDSAAPVDVDMTMLWLETGRWIVGMFP